MTNTQKYLLPLFIALLVLLTANPLKGQVNAGFSASVTQGCAPLLVKFTDNSTGNINSWNWDFGNGATSSIQNPATIYAQPGTYAVSLTVTGPGGTDTETKVGHITVFGVPTADFDVDTNEACEKVVFTFGDLSQKANSSTPIVSYFWDFGDGNSSVATNPQHAYTLSGSKSVSLRIIDANGCESYKQKNAVLLVNATPKIAFTADKTSSCIVPLTVNFTNQTAGSPYTFAWDLGNGNTSTAVSPSSTYTTAGSYTVSLVAVNTNTGCRDTLIKPAYIQTGNSNVDFVPSPTRGCKNQAVDFQLTGTGTPSNVLWTFGDGSSSNSTNGQNTYASPGTYTVTLVATFAGCVDSVKKSIIIDDVPVPSFTINPDKSCAVPFNVTFVNNTPGDGSFWDFGDGDTSSQRNTLHSYSAHGPFIISFTSISPGGCEAVLTDTIDFKPEILVKPSPRQTCGSSATVTFDYEINPTGATSFSWDFDDGNSSTQAKPTHTFTNEGQYIVKLSVAYPNGCTAVGQDTVSIFSPPIPDFESNLRDTCVKKTIRFTNKSSNFTSFEWDFGDGGKDSINVDPTHNYRSWPKILELPDSFDIKLTLWNGTCMKDTIITNYINIDPPLAWIETNNPEGLYCDTPAVVNFRDVSRYVNPRDTVYRMWYFDDPYAHKINFQQCTTDTKNNLNVGLNCNYSYDSLPTHRYSRFGNYNTQLWVFSHRTRCQDSINYLVRVRPKFETTMTVSKTTGCAPLQVSFDDPSTRSVSWFWDFGNSLVANDTDIVKQPSYTYSLPGKYNPTLYAKDADGCMATATKAIDVRGPRAGFKTGGKLCPPDTVSFFDISQKTDSLVTWHWDFGDNANSQPDTSNQRHPKFRFSGPGTYLVTLTATDNLGCGNSITRVVEYGPPIPDFKVVPEFICLNGEVNFQNYTKGGFANKYHWRFGDGDTSNLLNPNHTYVDTGKYSVFLRVTRSDGCVDSATIPQMVQVVDPEFDFSVNQNSGFCPPFTVVFTLNQSPDIEEYYWDFGDSSYSDLKNPIHTYNEPGLYSVSLRVKSRGGCYDSLIKHDYITVGGPKGSFSFDPKSGCNPLQVGFKSVAQNAVVYTWDYGDGTIDYLTTDSATHLYTKNGTFWPILILTDSNNCSITFTNEDSVYTNSNGLASFQADANEICVGGSIRFTDKSEPAASIVQRAWTVDGNPEGNGTQLNHQFNDTGAFIIRLTITDNIGCNNDTQMQVNVKSKPIITVSNDTSLCFGGDAVLFANGGMSYLWSPKGSLDDDTAATPRAKPLTTTDYQVIVKSGAGCPDVTETVRVTVWPLPAIDAGINQFVCNGDSVTLTVSGGISYQWEASPYLTDTLLPTTIAFPLVPTYFKVFGTDANGCSYYDSVLVEPIVAPIPEISGPEKVCYGSKITLTATGGDAFLWNTGETTPNIQAELYGDATFWISSSYKGCFGGWDTTEIEVDKSVFGADFTLQNDTFYTGEKIELSNTSFGALFYWWFPGDGKGPYADSIPNISYTKEGIYSITLIAESETGCRDTVSKSIVVEKDFIYFPNAFTPNRDLTNDLYSYFFPYKLATVELQIFDRWGELIFISTSQDHMWDGTYKGVTVPEGVYVYIFKGRKHNGEAINKQGTITLLR